MKSDEFWVLTTKGSTKREIENSLRKSIESDNRVFVFNSKHEAIEGRNYSQECEEDDVPKKVRVTIEVLE